MVLRARSRRASSSDAGPSQPRRLVQRFAERVASMPDAAFLGLLVSLHVIVSAVVLAVAGALPLDRLASSDVPLFDERAAAILTGDLIGRGASVAPDTPPLVNFLFLVPHLLGGGLFVYGVYFSAWVLGAAVALFLGLRHLDQGMARGAALLVVTHPFAWGTALLMVQDEVIVAALVAFAFVAALGARRVSAGFWSGIGTLVKAWPGVGAPVLFFAAERGRARWRLVLGGTVSVLLPVLPFLLLEPAYLLHVVGFYSSGVRPDRVTPSGLSFWKFLDEATGVVVEPVLVGLLFAASMMVWWAVARRRLGLEVAYPLGFLLLFVFYPKLHFGYYLILVVVLAPWLVRRPLAVFGSYVLAALLAVTHLWWHRLIPMSLGGSVGLPLALSGLSLVLVVLFGVGLVRDLSGVAAAGAPAGRPLQSRPTRGAGIAGGLGGSVLGLAAVLAVGSVVLFVAGSAP